MIFISIFHEFFPPTEEKSSLKSAPVALMSLTSWGKGLVLWAHAIPRR